MQRILNRQKEVLLLPQEVRILLDFGTTNRKVVMKSIEESHFHIIV